MEGRKIYEDSLKELQSVTKQLGTDSVTINLHNLDSTTAGYVREALVNTIAKRKREINTVINRVE